MLTPVKKPRSTSRSHGAASENVDPNLLSPAPPPSRRKPTKSPASSKVESKPKKSTTTAVTFKKIFCEVVDKDSASEKKKTVDEAKKSRDEKAGGVSEVEDSVAAKDRQLEGSSKMRKMRRRMLEEAMSSVPDPGAGRVMYLVKTFERLLSIKSLEPEGDGAGIGGAEENSKTKLMNWALPGLQQQQHPLSPHKAEVSETSSSFDDSSSSSDYERDSGEESSVIGREERMNFVSVESDGRGRKERNSSFSSESSWNKSLKVTSQQPFKLRTEQRGRFKEEYFINKVKEMLLGEEKKRIPMAQGLPWTTDEPECLMKPPVKQPTEPIDVILHSDVRAMERAEFDFHVAERINFVEQMKLERERQQKLEEEDEIKRLRRELVPRAQPMPYFDHPFVPNKSTKPKTVPKDPSFHL